MMATQHAHNKRISALANDSQKAHYNEYFLRDDYYDKVLIHLFK